MPAPLSEDEKVILPYTQFSKFRNAHPKLSVREAAQAFLKQDPHYDGELVSFSRPLGSKHVLYAIWRAYQDCPVTAQQMSPDEFFATANFIAEIGSDTGCRFCANRMRCSMEGKPLGQFIPAP